MLVDRTYKIEHIKAIDFVFGFPSDTKAPFEGLNGRFDVNNSFKEFFVFLLSDFVLEFLAELSFAEELGVLVAEVSIGFVHDLNDFVDHLVVDLKDLLFVHVEGLCLSQFSFLHVCNYINIE